MVPSRSPTTRDRKTTIKATSIETNSPCHRNGIEANSLPTIGITAPQSGDRGGGAPQGCRSRRSDTSGGRWHRLRRYGTYDTPARFVEQRQAETDDDADGDGNDGKLEAEDEAPAELVEMLPDQAEVEMVEHLRTVFPRPLMVPRARKARGTVLT